MYISLELASFWAHYIYMYLRMTLVPGKRSVLDHDLDHLKYLWRAHTCRRAPTVGELFEPSWPLSTYLKNHAPLYLFKRISFKKLKV